MMPEYRGPRGTVICYVSTPSGSRSRRGAEPSFNSLRAAPNLFHVRPRACASTLVCETESRARSGALWVNFFSATVFGARNLLFSRDRSQSTTSGLSILESVFFSSCWLLRWFIYLYFYLEARRIDHWNLWIISNCMTILPEDFGLIYFHRSRRTLRGIRSVSFRSMV